MVTKWRYEVVSFEYSLTEGVKWSFLGDKHFTLHYNTHKDKSSIVLSRSSWHRKVLDIKQ